MLNADPNQEELIQYRLKQAGDTVKEVRILVENNLIKIAVNRVYYGMFYMLSALALKNGYQTSKHLQFIGWFFWINVLLKYSPEPWYPGCLHGDLIIHLESYHQAVS